VAKRVKDPNTGAGASRIVIDEHQLLELSKMHCSHREIAAFFDCSTDTITNNFSHIVNKGRELGKISLRRAQLKAAINGNVVMQIWLGKQLLGQVDKIEQKIDIEVFTPLSSREALEIIKNDPFLIDVSEKKEEIIVSSEDKNEVD